MTVIGFVPARGGSERIPRKNLRAVHGVPLVARTVRCLRAAGIDRVIVSTDDREIADVARLWGAEIDVRPSGLAGPGVTIDQVVDEWLTRRMIPADAHDVIASRNGDLWVAVAQPTSPLLTPATVANAVDYAVEHGENVFSATAERGLLWTPSTTPLFSRRQNSTTLDEPEYFRETGGLVVINANARAAGSPWPGVPATMMTIDTAEAIDVDEYFDLARARAGEKPRRIQLRYVEGSEIGHGHRRRCETLAAELAGRHLVAVVDHHAGPVGDEVPDLVVLDVLDTKVEDVQGLYDVGVEFVVTLEDLGLGTSLADLTINELYGPGFDVTAFGDPKSVRLHGARPEHSGPKWAVLRAEFQGHPFYARDGRKPKTVVVSFGGTDPAHMTEQVVNALQSIEAVEQIRVVLPPARPFIDLPDSVKVESLTDPCMASEFLNAHLAITSSGRTVHEAAACGCPVIAIPVNDRERMHDVCPGVMYLESGSEYLGKAAVADVLAGKMFVRGDFTSAPPDPERAHAAVDGLGAQRIAYLIDGLLAGLL